MWKLILCTVLTCQIFIRDAYGFRDEMTIGDGCGGNEDCVEIVEAVCDLKSEECVCKDGFVPSSNKTACFKLATEPGGECEIQEQCMHIPLATCKNQTCVTADLMSSTNKSVNACGNGSRCSEGHCQNGTCVEEPVKVTNSLNLNILGGKNCSNDSDCQWAKESICGEDRRCRCRPEFVPSQNLKSCLPEAKSLGDECLESVQCLSLNGSVCMDKKCTEKMTSFLKTFSNGIPQPLLLGSSCSRNEECSHIANSACKESICECTENYVTSVSSNTCLVKGQREGDACEVDQQCEKIKGAYCTGGKCVKPASVGRSLGRPKSAATRKESAATAVLSAVLILKICFV